MGVEIFSKTEVEMFLILHKPSSKFLGFSVQTNSPGEFCVDTEFSFELDCGNIWVTIDLDVAKRAIKEHPKWYNAGFETPINNFNSDDLEVWKIMKVAASEGK